MSASLVLDVLIVALLAATVGYCAVLNARLGRLRENQQAFRSLIGELKEATMAAEKGVGQMKTLTHDVAGTLDERITMARALCDELGVIVESGNNLADRLAKRLTGGAEDAPPAKAGERPGADAKSEKGGRSEAEKELLSMLRSVR